MTTPTNPIKQERDTKVADKGEHIRETEGAHVTNAGSRSAENQSNHSNHSNHSKQK